MRTILPVLLLLLLAAGALGAQEDSTARRDSLARRDSARMAREGRRIAGEAASRKPERTADDAAVRRRTVSAALGLVGPGDWLEVEAGDGLTMGTGIGLRVGVDATWPRWKMTDLAASLRVSRAQPRLDGDELAGDAGGVTAVDLLVGVERIVGARTRIRAAVGGALVLGPDVDPWGNDSALSPAADASIALRVSGPWSIALGAGAMRYSGVSTSAESNAGMVLRPWGEVRYAF
jgi:hypothetical protein